MRARRGQLLEVTVTDGRARLALTFFNKVQMFERQLTPGRHGMFAGRVSTFKGRGSSRTPSSSCSAPTTRPWPPSTRRN